MNVRESFKVNKSAFIEHTKGSLTSHYEVLKKLGEGTFGKVYRIKSKSNGEIRAMKQIPKTTITNQSQFEMEIEIMAKMDHPNIIKLYECIEDDRFVYLIMEECSGGELFERIIEKTKGKKMFTEKEAAVIFKELMSAICYCHINGVCHRDLKPENLMFDSLEDDSPIKIIDFGYSKIIQQDSAGKFKRMTTKVGTLYYVSPEVIQGNYDEKCDIWSCGVILYLMLSGKTPFNGTNEKEVYKLIENKKFSFPPAQWKSISLDVQDLIKKMICPIEKRLSAKEVLEHEWVSKCAPNAEGYLTDLNIESLNQYKNSHKFRKAVLMYMATRLNESEVKEMKKIFEELDMSKTGMITLDELIDSLEKLEIDGFTTDIEELFQSIDTDHDGFINYTEFIAATLDKKIYLQEERLYEAFKAFDQNDTGKISKKDIMQVLKLSDKDSSALEKIIKENDLNGDGTIDYQEFMQMMQGE